MVGMVLLATTGKRFPPCERGVFENNLVIHDRRVRTAVNVGAGTAPETFIVRGSTGSGASRFPSQVD